MAGKWDVFSLQLVIDPMIDVSLIPSTTIRNCLFDIPSSALHSTPHWVCGSLVFGLWIWPQWLLRTSWTVGKGTGNSKIPKGFWMLLEILNWTILNMKAFEKACDAGARTVQGNGHFGADATAMCLDRFQSQSGMYCTYGKHSTAHYVVSASTSSSIQLAGQASPPKLSIKSRIVGDVYHCSTHQIKGSLLLLCGHVLLDLSTHQSSQSSRNGSNCWITLRGHTKIWYRCYWVCRFASQIEK